MNEHICKIFRISDMIDKFIIIYYVILALENF
jgi:hypothetical protein